MPEQFLEGKVELHCGDSREVLKTLPDNSMDSIVCDPPYALVSIQKRFGKPGSAPVKVSDISASNDLKAAYARASAGFMGKQWDTGETAFAVEFWTECLRVLKPGGHVVAFSGTRTYHRMAVAIEDAGFEIRDQIQWLYGSGFPKSHNAGNGWGTALKPSCEPICLARKPLIGTVAANVLEWGCGAINIDGCRVETIDEISNHGESGKSIPTSFALGRRDPMQTNGQKLGRWPANLVHDGSEEVIAAFPASDGGGDIHKRSSPKTSGVYGEFAGDDDRWSGYGDQGSAARFFYTAKADADDRLGSKHPTVKPVDLMQWLVRLVTPKGGTCLDPFAGTGTTAEAAFREGMRCILIERETEYQADIKRRMALVMAGPDERARESIKAKTKDQPLDLGPLFSYPQD